MELDLPFTTRLPSRLRSPSIVSALETAHENTRDAHAPIFNSFENIIRVLLGEFQTIVQ